MKAQKSFKLIVLASLFFILLNGCEKNRKEFSQEKPHQSFENLEMQKRQTDAVSDKIKMSEVDLVKLTFPFASDDKTTSVMGRMIVRTGTINIEVEKFDDTEKKVTETANKFSGYITNTSSNLNAGGKEQGSISVRIPSNKFDAFISEVSAFGKVMSQNISGNDVTEEYIDLEARQRTQKELENRLLQLLSEKTAKLTDVVEVEQKLSNVRENIERTEGRMKFLKDQSAFSTLTISLFEPSLLQTSSGGGFFYEIRESFKKGIEGFTEITSLLITFIISSSPFLIFLAILLFILKKYLRNRKLKKAAVQTN